MIKNDINNKYILEQEDELIDFHTNFYRNTQKKHYLIFNYNN